MKDIKVQGYEAFKIWMEWADQQRKLEKYISKMEYKVRSLKLEELDKLLSYGKN